TYLTLKPLQPEVFLCLYSFVYDFSRTNSLLKWLYSKLKEPAMENDKNEKEYSQESPQPIENDYDAHKNNPGPPIEAVEEKNNDGAGKMLKYIIPILVLVLLIIWFLFRE